MKLLGYAICALAGLSAILATGCNDLPTEVGIQTDTLEIYAISSLEDESIILRSDNYGVELPVVYGSGSALLGNTELTSGSIFLGFATPPDTLASLTLDQILDPKITLNFDRYSFGDSLSTFGFDIVRTMYELPEIVKWEWAYGASVWPASDKYDIGDPLITYNDLMPLGDTNVIELSLPKELIKEYLEITAAKGDTFSFPQGDYPFGLALVAKETNTQFRRLFTSISNATELNPKISFSYQGPDSLMEVQMDAAISGQLLKPATPLQGDIIIGSGVRRRSQLLFDLSSIPQDADVISSALWIYSKPELNEFGNITPDSLIVIDSLRNINDSLQSRNTYAGAISEDGDVYFPTLSAFMAGWNLYDGIDTVSLLPIRPVSRLDRMVFHGASAAVGDRPKLVIIYQMRPGV